MPGLVGGDMWGCLHENLEILLTVPEQGEFVFDCVCVFPSTLESCEPLGDLEAAVSIFATTRLGMLHLPECHTLNVMDCSVYTLHDLYSLCVDCCNQTALVPSTCDVQRFFPSLDQTPVILVQV